MLMFLGFLVFVFLLFQKKIMSFLQPDKWLKSIILEKDNSITARLIKKNRTNTFEFKKGIYNLVEGSNYRIGRLGCFVHVEDNENPVDLKKIEATGNPLLNNMIINQRVDELWYETNDQRDLIIKIVIICLIIGIIIFIAMAFMRGQQPNV